MKPNSEISEAYCYVGMQPGEPGAFAACVDNPDRAKDTAKFVSRIIKKGGTVDRVTVEKAREMLKEWIEWDRGRRIQKLGI